MSFIIQSGGESNYGATTMDFAIDVGGTTIQFKDFTSGAILDTYPANSCTATVNSEGIRIEFIGGQKVLINKLNVATIKVAGTLQTSAQADIVNALNTLFANVGGGNAPTITSGDIALTVGDTINYQLTGTNVVAWSWDSLPHASLVTQTGNPSKLIGGSTMTVGTYTAVARATNYNGSVTKDIDIVVSAAFTNTKSFSPHSGGTCYFQKTAAGVENNTPLYRAAGNSGSAWTAFGWLKNNAGSTDWKPVLYFGDYGSGAGGTGLGRVRFYIRNSTTWPYNTIELYFSYGAATSPSTNDIKFSGLAAGVAKNTWFSFMLVYDGSNTNNNANSSDGFSIYINGVQLSPSWTVTGGGYGGSIEYISGFDKSQFNIGRGELSPWATAYANVVYFDEIALWQSDQSANAATFHNSGTPIDLSSYTPYAYYKFGDAATDISGYPIMEDIGSTGTDLTMYNGTVANYLSDTP
jgi:hypothetical protein